MKRTFDFVLALIGLLFSLPLWLFIAIMVKLEDGGPVFYAQKRVGKEESVFVSLKFRSMVNGLKKNVELVAAKENDPRETKIGRFLRATAMDELPQLLNILKGDMSFVGPRPLPPEEKDPGSDKIINVFAYNEFKERCIVRPGLTGVAQVLLPRDILRETKFRYDIWYIKNQSFWLDIYLIFLSFLITLQGNWEIRQDKLKRVTSDFKSKIDKCIG